MFVLLKAGKEDLIKREVCQKGFRDKTLDNLNHLLYLHFFLAVSHRKYASLNRESM